MKYPIASAMRWAGLRTYASRSPPSPSRTIAALGRMSPGASVLTVDAFGRVAPEGQRVAYPGPVPIMVTFNTTAPASAGDAGDAGDLWRDGGAGGDLALGPGGRFGRPGVEHTGGAERHEQPGRGDRHGARDVSDGVGEQVDAGRAVQVDRTVRPDGDDDEVRHRLAGTVDVDHARERSGGACGPCGHVPGSVGARGGEVEHDGHDALRRDAAGPEHRDTDRAPGTDPTLRAGIVSPGGCRTAGGVSWVTTLPAATARFCAVK